MRIALAADHAGFDLKDELAAWLEEQGHDVADLGTARPAKASIIPTSAPSSPSHRRRRGRARDRRLRLGHRHFDRRQPRTRRAAARGSTTRLSAELAREHNDANVLALGAPADRQRHGQGLRRSPSSAPISPAAATSAASTSCPHRTAGQRLMANAAEPRPTTEVTPSRTASSPSGLAEQRPGGRRRDPAPNCTASRPRSS